MQQYIFDRIKPEAIVLLLVAMFIGTPMWAETVLLTAPDGTPVTIARDDYGVPHITAETETGVFFGQGFAVAQDRLFQMEQIRRAAEGKLSEWFGGATLNADKETRMLFYTKAEKMEIFNNLPTGLQTAFQAYTDGVNTYLDSMDVNPAKYTPQELSSPVFQMERWSITKSIAVANFLMRIFGQFGGEELTRLAELQANGSAWFETNRPINDPNAPTTIPDGGLAAPQSWHYAGMTVRPEVVDEINRRQAHNRQINQQHGIPNKFGSFAVQIMPAKSGSGNVMLLGCPQMGEPKVSEPNVVHEVELDCPTFHVGGMTVAGLPLVIIGHTAHHAWTFTSGISDNSDVYIDSTADATFNRYYHEGQWLDFEVVEDTVYNVNTPVSFTHYRTVHGPVFGDDLPNHQVYSMKMTFWMQELGMAKFLYNNIKAQSLAEFETALAMNPMSFNTFYADVDQNIKYWHVGKFQDRSDGVDPRLPHNGDGSEEWGGFIPFENLPQAADPAQGYFVNWNNKPVSWWNHGDNVPWVGSHRVAAVDNFVGPISSFSYDNLKDVPFQIQSHGTYQQAIELSASEIIDENIVPPGQSGFKDINGIPSPHINDQWSLHVNWQFKDQLFGQPITGIGDEDGATPKQFSLAQNFPNPFNPATTIRYRLPRAAKVVLEIYNLLGKRVATLVNGDQSAGEKSVIWDGKNAAGAAVGSGLYFYRLQADDNILTRKMLLLK